MCTGSPDELDSLVSPAVDGLSLLEGVDHVTAPFHADDAGSCNMRSAVAVQGRL